MKVDLRISAFPCMHTVGFNIFGNPSERQIPEKSNAQRMSAVRCAGAVSLWAKAWAIWCGAGLVSYQGLTGRRGRQEGETRIFTNWHELARIAARERKEVRDF
jgi:hypothetical protein